MEVGANAGAMRSAANQLVPHGTLLCSPLVAASEGQGRDVCRVGLFSLGGEEKNGKW